MAVNPTPCGPGARRSPGFETDFGDSEEPDFTRLPIA